MKNAAFASPKGCGGKHVTESLTLPTSLSLFWLPPIPTQLVESVPPTHSHSCSVIVLVMVFPIPAFSSLLQSSATWPGPPSASQSHGPCSSGCFSFLFPFLSSTISQSLSDHIIFIPSSTLLPLKLYGVFCTFLSPLCLCVLFLLHSPRLSQIFCISCQLLVP